ncbi:MAG: hypothetical protein IPK07_21745 [Deltaproteobacteria bacterium]|nr:hypothetical protein [Deltaproteobacteria bacterium]
MFYVVVAYLNSDSHLDVAVTTGDNIGPNSSSVAVLLGDGRGGFSAPTFTFPGLMMVLGPADTTET